MKVRIGIDVGGTFTDAVAVDNETYELIDTVKIPTTHDDPAGVAAGIIRAINQIMERCKIAPEDVVFIAHGTTQATNALLEGDVAQVGIVTMGTGVEGAKAKMDTNMGSIPLAGGTKSITPINTFVNTGTPSEFEKLVDQAVDELLEKGAQAIVATESFSVDNPENENFVVENCSKKDCPASAGNDVSKLYGLKVRTRTAVVNASILPKMLSAATMTEESIKNAKIQTPLMIMRCDGGVMTVDEVRKRPILTILSGPAAGVAGALMYEKLTDGIFLEVGGTSTDISCVRDGNVMIKYAEVGGHKTYLNSLDVRTAGIGGGSMVQISDGKAVNMGPRSAHIAGLAYECYTGTEDIADPVLYTVRPTETDAEYAYIQCSNGKKFALTQSGAALICGYVKEKDYAYGNAEAARKAWAPLAKNMGMTVEETAKLCLDMSAKINGKVINSLIEDYGLDLNTLVFVGGGGGSASVVPHLAETFQVQHKIPHNAEVISPIGVALAMVRDVVERTIPNATKEDLLAIRTEAVQKAIASGANADTVDVKLEVDAKSGRVRAIAVGATELRAKTLGGKKKDTKELLELAAASMKIPVEKVKIAAETDSYMVTSGEIEEKVFLFLKKKSMAIRVIDRDGIIRLQRHNGGVHVGKRKNLEKHIEHMLEQFTIYMDAGEEVPNLWIISGNRLIDLSGLQSRDQILALANMEVAGVDPEEKLVFICTKTAENKRH